MNRSPFLVLLVPAAALVAGIARWLIQGSGNLYTATSKRFYVPDPDLGYRVSSERPFWLGLEVIAMIAAVTAAMVVASWLIRRRERRQGTPMKVVRVGLAVVALATFIPPVLAFISGGRPTGGVDVIPTAAAVTATSGIQGKLDLPTGRYVVAAHEGSSITARLKAGKEEFDARFAGGITGFWDGTPSDLTAPMSSLVEADAASVDTGVALRSEHARDEYLYVGKFPKLGFRLGKLITTTQVDANTVAFTAEGSLQLMGAWHDATVSGTLRAADAAAQTRLGISGPALIVLADTRLAISQTALSADADSFDSDDVPIHVSLVLVSKPN